ncbi:MAG: CDP-diacylglycerol--glycerol-3-phosphate 3-phosphatidyltransferase [Rhodospirillales bacterium]|jgi:cardiolipin synthase (CMP-forming)|nr:CDP-diacylglycerol--glycerol-3-phosphate 3-phosphatidyltransferase [Rhodospirillales bacterium]MBT4038418.1 CDP-diacylglycerol--glycerol-3-phosphate 3-phosphatidyltransferase [Rhodospirillales bacterium]MBT4625713.1 CDP-diacylglycerol--glycerol-3-phosphate 3-phosphatidyltransferase [Rhodospirillales bacterium]MBT5352379.1 CDP-diacylglycerol--glycerol-3-phosphate 3-phosphatidyltransferase [Rhodospirillales bacterium]MBT5519825.1 CDP-diacylglycerol--glycerol-3-phosphate 3-phosphatidyltransfera
MYLKLPNILTYTRLISAPIVAGLFFVPDPLGSWLAFSLYTYACVTDFLDGYLARAWHMQSALGRFLDPIADKMLVAAVIFALLAADRIAGYEVIAAGIILAREILVSGLREFLAELRVGMPVSHLAKWKTGIQMLALGFLLVGPNGPDFWGMATIQIGVVGLWMAAALTLITGFDYLYVGLKHINETDQAPMQRSGDDAPEADEPEINEPEINEPETGEPK